MPKPYTMWECKVLKVKPTHSASCNKMYVSGQLHVSITLWLRYGCSQSYSDFTVFVYDF
jgi:hypothetical protein